MMRLAMAIVATLIVYMVAQQATSALTPALGTLVADGHRGWLLAAIAGFDYFAAFTAGAAVSRGPFLLPALGVWAVVGTTALGTGYRVRIAATPTRIDMYLADQLPLIGLTLAGTLLGVVFGAYLSRRFRTWVAG